MNLFNRLAATILPFIAALAEPPPVRMELPPALSNAFRRAEQVAHKVGLPCTADGLATAFAHAVEQLVQADDGEPCETCHILARLDLTEDQVANNNEALQRLRAKLDALLDRIRRIEINTIQPLPGA